jgi:hypothetical protein
MYNSRPFKLFLIAICAFAASSCASHLIEITESSSIITDSLSLDMDARNVRIWQSENSHLVSFNNQPKIFDCTSFINPKSNTALIDYGVFKLNERAYYNCNSPNKGVWTHYNNVLKIYPKKPNGHSYDGKTYVLQSSSNNMFLKLSDSTFFAPVFVYHPTNSSSIKERLTRNNLDRLGHFKLIDSNITLMNTIIPFPRDNFFLGDTRAIYCQPTMCLGENEFYYSYDFIDSIFVFDFEGKFKKSIPLAKELNFKYYDNTTKIHGFESLMSSQIYGDKLAAIKYNKAQNNLLAITIKGLSEDKTYEITPSFEEMDWFISIYDLSTESWTKIIHFSGDMEFRNVLVCNRNIFVKRKHENPAKFIKYTY